jgi:rhamnulokinase
MSNAVHFLAVDLGASSGRVVLGAWDGVRFALEELHRFPNDPVQLPGGLHWDVLRLWSELKLGLSAYAARFGGAPVGIGVDTWGVDFALLDRAGALLGNPYHYRDARTGGMVERVCSQVPRREIFEQTGIQFVQINTLYQLASMAAAGDPRLEVAETLLLMPDLLHYWLTGRKAVEYTNATTTQCLHARERRWAGELLGRLGLPVGMLPEVIAPGTVLGELRGEVAAEVGLPGGALVVAPATHDTGSAVAAIPGLDARSAYISSGTWSLVGVEVPEPVIDERALALNLTNEGGVAGTIRLLKNVMGLWLVQECQRQWQREGHSYSWEQLLVWAQQAAPFASMVDPDDDSFFYPGNMPEVVRDYCRRSGQPVPESPGAVMRCCLESLALKYRVVIEALEQVTGRSLGTIRVVGGGSRNRLLCQWTADACGRPVVAGPVEATALGNILLQAIATGHLPDLQAGRAAVAASTQLDSYAPRDGMAWQAASERFKVLL